MWRKQLTLFSSSSSPKTFVLSTLMIISSANIVNLSKSFDFYIHSTFWGILPILNLLHASERRSTLNSSAAMINADPVADIASLCKIKDFDAKVIRCQLIGNFLNLEREISHVDVDQPEEEHQCEVDLRKFFEIIWSFSWFIHVIERCFL